MNIYELQKKTTVYNECGLVSTPLQWSNSKILKVYQDKNGNWSLVEKPNFSLFGFIHPVDEYFEFMNFDKLPTEFFNHQLKTVDSEDVKSIETFIKTWGFPFLPFRNMAHNVTTWEYDDLDHIKNALAATEEIREFAFILGAKYFKEEDDYETTDKTEEWLKKFNENECLLDIDYPIYGDCIPTKDEEEYYKGLYTLDNFGICDAISLTEAAYTIELLQNATDAILETARNNAIVSTKHLDIINMGASYPQLLHWNLAYTRTKTIQQFYSLFTSAICNQIIEAFNDDAPWRDCACEGCNTTFKRKQSKSNSPASDSVYCCSACEERQKKRNQRKAAKNRIKH